MNHWLTTLLIFLPVAGALLVAVAPLSGYWLGSLAALISLVEIGFWISAAARFDFNDPRLQFQQRHAGSTTSASATTSASTRSRSGSSARRSSSWRHA